MKAEISSTDGGVTSDVFERCVALEKENENLRSALDSRVIIEQAKGAVSARCGVDPDVAFEMLRGLALSQHREIHEFAAEVVAHGGRLGA